MHDSHLEKKAVTLETMQIIADARKLRTPMNSLMTWIIIKFSLLCLPLFILSIGIMLWSSISALMSMSAMPMAEPARLQIVAPSPILTMMSYVIIFFTTVISYHVLSIPATMLGIRTAAGMKNDMTAIRNDINHVRSSLLPFIFICAGVTTVVSYFSGVIIPALVAKDSLASILLPVSISLLMFLAFIPISYFMIPLMVTKRMSMEAAWNRALGMITRHIIPIILSYIIVAIAYLFLNTGATVISVVAGTILSLVLGKIIGAIISIVFMLYIYYRLFVAFMTIYFAMIGVIFCKICGLKNDNKVVPPEDLT